jgi:transposase
VQSETGRESTLDITPVTGYMEDIGVYRYKDGILRNNQKDLKKNEFKPWRVREWCIPPEKEEEFVAGMENILDVYARKYDKKHPLVCMDELSCQLIGEVRVPIPASKGQTERFDTEYKRNGTCAIFMFASPLEGWRRAEVSECRTKIDWAGQIKKLVDMDFPHAEKIVLVMDNLNTHTIGSLYKAFSPEEARRLRNKLELHYTPKHGSWLNMAEIEINILANHGLSKRVSTMEQMQKEVASWVKARNQSANKINWRFTTEDARIKLKRLYPLFN